jgi:hypothetical protein
MKLNKLASIVGAALALSATGFSSTALADSALISGVGNAQARLDFQIIIPRILSFRVGNAAAGTIDMISFQPTAAQVVGALPVSATSGGDISPGVVTAKVVGNNGQITVAATTLGALTNGGAGSIPWTQITTAATALTSATPLAAPVLQNGASPTVNAPAPVANVTTADAKWTFTYTNSAIPAAGTYGGVNLNNGRVIYTAAMP